MTEISVIIPVYKGSQLLPEILEKLTKERNIDKEIFVVIDEPDEHSLKLVEKFGKEVNFIINRKRMGKATALNQAVNLSKGEILLFLDSDIEIGNRNFLRKVVEEIQDADILDIKKEVIKDSFLSKMTYYEYLGFNIGSFLCSKFIRKMPAINGSAFAIRKKVLMEIGGFRKVIAEDLDIATRAFLKNFKFKYSKKVLVKNYVHSKWKRWFVQRKRWSIGCALWVKEWYRELIKKCVKKPQIILPSLFFLFPSITLVLINFLSPDLLMYKFLDLIIFFLSVKFNLMTPILSFILATTALVKSLIPSFMSFFVTAVLFFAFSRKLNFQFKIHEFFVYYFLYSLIGLLMVITALIIVFIIRKLPVISDWKI